MSEIPNFAYVANEYLARSHFQLSEPDLSFLLESAKKIEPLLPAQFVVAIPCHINDICFIPEMIGKLVEQKTRVCIFVNCLRGAVDNERFKEIVEGLEDYLKKAVSIPKDSVALISSNDENRLSMGRIRATLTDSILVASLNQKCKPWVVHIDADTLAIADCFVSEVRRHGKDLRTYMVAANICYGYDPGGQSYVGGGLDVPELFLANKVQHAILECARLGKINYESRIWAEGAGFAFDLYAYCRVSGFDRERESGEDDLFGFKIHKFGDVAFRVPIGAIDSVDMEVKSNISYAADAWLVTDPRRQLFSIYAGMGGTEAWDVAPFAEKAGFSMSSTDLAEAYSRASDRITVEKINAFLGGDKSIGDWVFHRSIKLIGRMIRADIRVQNGRQANEVWETLGLADLAERFRNDDLDTRDIERLLRCLSPNLSLVGC